MSAAQPLAAKSRSSSGTLLHLRETFGELDVGSPGIREESDGDSHARYLPIGRIELDASVLQFLRERLQIADLEADVVEGAAFGGGSFRIGLGEGEIDAGEVGGFEPAAL